MGYDELMDLENDLVNHLGELGKEEYETKLKEYKQLIQMRTTKVNLREDNKYE